MDDYKIISTSRHSAECDPILLRQTSTTKLIFCPLMVDNPHSKKATIKGNFIFQKKGKNDTWENHKKLNLSNLKAQEWIKLEIKSEELLTLLEGLYPLYKISHKDGIPFGETRYVKVKANLEELSKITEQDLKTFFQLNKKAGAKLLNSFLNYAANLENPQQVVDRLEKLEIDNLQKLNSLVGLSNLKKCYNTWLTNETNANEEFWQQLFLNNSFILSQIFPFPILLIKGKAYVGGKTVANTGGNLVDFLCKNEITKNAVLIEIKTPSTKLLGKLYRDNIYNISEEISGSIMQLANYKNSLYLDYDSVTRGMTLRLNSFYPHCVVIAGNMNQELTDDTKERSFELFRNNLRDSQIISFDELFGKISNLIDLFENKST